MFLKRNMIGMFPGTFIVIKRKKGDTENPVITLMIKKTVKVWDIRCTVSIFLLST